jgi:hypothetical protein
MSERMTLTDRRIAELCDQRETFALGRSSAAEMRVMAAELRERRAQDLTPDEVEALEWLVRHLRVSQMEGVPPRGAKRDALATLDRLLGGRK